MITFLAESEAPEPIPYKSLKKHTKSPINRGLQKTSI
jgi:hypothetical protein